MFDEVDAPASVGEWQTSWAPSSGHSGLRSRSSALRTCRRSPRTPTHYLIEKHIEGAHRTTVRRLGEDDRTGGDWPHVGGANVTDQVRASAREMLMQRRGAASPHRRGERRKKSKGESESRKNPSKPRPKASKRLRSMARKALIETYGCQMNAHRPERNGWPARTNGCESTDDAADADVVVINTCSVREHAEDKLYTRLGELKVLAAEQGHNPSSPLPAAWPNRRAPHS